MSELELRPAADFTLEQLTAAYNQTRVDYIVPMPMNTARLQEYIHNYDVDLSQSVVAMVEGEILGLAMLGVRDHHTWVTRLGVLPTRRRHGAGEAMMRHMIRCSRDLCASYIVLEVIEGNAPAYHMFTKLGFRPVRELLILRRPPGLPQQHVTPYVLHQRSWEEALQLLERRRSTPSWLDEYPSLKNAGNLLALEVQLADGGAGWMVYQSTLFQLARLVLQTEAGDAYEVARALVHALHSHHPMRDTKTENIPRDDPHLQGMLDMGYIESFSRIEMRLESP